MVLLKNWIVGKRNGGWLEILYEKVTSDATITYQGLDYWAPDLSFEAISAGIETGNFSARDQANANVLYQLGDKDIDKKSVLARPVRNPELLEEICKYALSDKE